MLEGKELRAAPDDPNANVLPSSPSWGQTDTVSVDQARAVLTRAEAEQTTQQRAELIQKLSTVRAEHRQAQARYEELATSIKTRRKERAEWQQKINQVVTRIQESWHVRPEVAEYLPDDPEVMEWQRKHTILEQERATLIQNRDQIPDPEGDVKEAGAFEGVHGSLAQLEFTERNILAQLDPKLKPTNRITGGGVISGVR